MIHIVLVEPEIPQNTGNIARTCAATGSELHLVKPLDYWPLVKVHVHENFAELLAAYPDAPFFYASTKAPRSYAQAEYPRDVFLVFGRESRGLPENLLERVYDRCIRIPMIEGARSLNLSNSVAIVTYEALRQHGFEHLLDHGALTGRDEEPGAWMDYL